MSELKRKLSTKPYKGTRDFYPQTMRLRNHIFDTMRSTAKLFGYEEYDGPLLEKYEVYAAKTGEEIVNEQLYHFEDRGGRHVAIRPEMTPTVARMVAARIQELPKPIRWFSIPNLWRYERPQRGRLREHWQFNVDIFGVDTIDADAEIIELSAAVMRAFGAKPGDFEIRISNRRLLNEFFEKILKLDDTHSSAISRIIDKKDKVTSDIFSAMLKDARLDDDKILKLNNFLALNNQQLKLHPAFNSIGGQEIASLFDKLDESELRQYCRLDLSIVRGLDYYTGTVFEMYDTSPKNRRALFGGGRYDDLVGLFSSVQLSGVGFGMGDVTVEDFLKTHDLVPDLTPAADVFITLFDENCLPATSQISRNLRRNGCRVYRQLEPAKLGKQFKQADQMNIPIVVVMGPDEIAAGEATLKYLATKEQVTLRISEVVHQIQKWLAGI